MVGYEVDYAEDYEVDYVESYEDDCNGQDLDSKASWYDAFGPSISYLCYTYFSSP